MYIYKFTNSFNGMSYIGQTCDIKKRFNNHKNNIFNITINTKFIKGLRQFGFENFIFTVLFECNFEDVDLMENYCIDLYDSSENGYNIVHKKYDKNKARKIYNNIITGNYVVYEPYRFISGKTVTCLNDYEVFSSVAECERYYNIRHVNDVCTGNRATVNNLVFRYLDDNGNIIEPLNSARKKTTEVFVEETGVIYDSIVSAIKDINEDMDKGAISAHLRGKTENCYGFHFHYVINDEIQPSSYVSRKVSRGVLVDDSMEFSSVSEAIKYFNLPKNARGAISQCARGKSSSAYEHTWSYIDTNTGDVIINEFKPKLIDRSKVKRYEIICDDKYTFRSLAKACKFFNYNSNCAKQIAQCCRGLQDSAFGHTWKYGKQL